MGGAVSTQLGESDLNSDRPSPGGNAGLPKIGSNGDYPVDSEAEEIALNPRRIVAPIRGWDFTALDKPVEHHTIPFRAMVVWACSSCTQSLCALCWLQSMILPECTARKYFFMSGRAKPLYCLGNVRYLLERRSFV